MIGSTELHCKNITVNKIYKRVSKMQSKQEIIEEVIPSAGDNPKIRKYLKGKLLGQGGFATCYEVTDLETKKSFAAKIIPKSSLARPKTKSRVTKD